MEDKTQEHGSGRDKEIEIIVNGRKNVVTKNELAFMEVVQLAFDPVPTGENVVFTVTYRKADGKKHEGTLVEGETLHVKDGTIINVIQTDKS